MAEEKFESRVSMSYDNFKSMVYGYYFFLVDYKTRKTKEMLASSIEYQLYLKNFKEQYVTLKSYDKLVDIETL